MPAYIFSTHVTMFDDRVVSSEGEDMAVIFICAGCALAGFLFGLLASRIMQRRRFAGVLRLDRSDPDEAPYLFLLVEPNGGMDRIMRGGEVVFKAETGNFVTRN